MRGKVAAKIGPQKDPPVEKSLFFAEPSGCPGDQPPRLDGLRQAPPLASFVSPPGSGNGKGKSGRPKSILPRVRRDRWTCCSRCHRAPLRTTPSSMPLSTSAISPLLLKVLCG